MSADHTKRIPYVHGETKAYWNGARQHELWIQRCRACSVHYFYPRDFCPSCFSFDVEWTKACGRGTVYSYTVCLRPAPGFEKDVPYNIALVELAEGVRMMSTVVDCPPDDLKIGMLVEVVFEDVSQDVTLPKFKPAGNPLPLPRQDER